MTGKISTAHAERLKQRGLDIDLCEALGFRSSDGALGHDYIVNGRVLNTKLRRGKGNMPWERKWDGQTPPLWNIDSLKGPIEPGEMLVITEGELDGASVVQAEFGRTVSVPTGAPPKPEGRESDRYRCFMQGDRLHPDIDKFEKIILAVDGDEKGQFLRDDLAMLLGDHRCWWVRWPVGCKDANDVLQKGLGEREIVNAISDAKVMWNDEIGRISEFAISDGSTYGIGFGQDDEGKVPNNFDHIVPLNLRFEMPSFVVMMGPYHGGKSTFLRQLLWNMWKIHGWKFLLTCLEEKPRPRVENKFLRLELGFNPANQDFFENVHTREANHEALVKARAELERAAVFMVRPKRKLLTTEHFFDRIQTAVRREGVRVIALDPVNELDHHIVGNEAHYWNNFILDCKAIADEFELLFIVCGHPGKEGYGRLAFGKLLRAVDMTGAASWGNKADVAMCLWRTSTVKDTTLLHLEKTKDHETMGPAPMLYELRHDNKAQKFYTSQVGWHLWEDEKKGKK